MKNILNHIIMMLSLVSFGILLPAQQKQQSRMSHEMHTEIQSLLIEFLREYSVDILHTEIQEMEDAFASDADLLIILSEEIYTMIYDNIMKYHNYGSELSEQQQAQSIQSALDATKKRLYRVSSQQEVICVDQMAERDSVIAKIAAHAAQLYQYVLYTIKRVQAENQQNNVEEKFAHNFFIVRYQEDHGEIVSGELKQRLVVQFRTLVNVLASDSLRLMNQMINLLPETIALLPQSEKTIDLAEKLVIKQKIVMSTMSKEAKHTCIKHVQQFIQELKKIIEGRFHLDQQLVTKLAEFSTCTESVPYQQEQKEQEGHS